MTSTGTNPGASADSGMTALGVGRDTDSVRLVFSRAGAVVTRWSFKLPDGTGLEESVDSVLAPGSAILDQLQSRIHHPLRIGISTPAASPGTGSAYDRLQRLLQCRLAIPVELYHAVTTAALAEFNASPKKPHSLLFLRIGTTIDTALIVGGAVHSGLGGALPPLAHSAFADPQLRCHCGRSGCLEAAASLTRLRPHTAGDDTMGVHHHSRCRAPARQIITESGRATGKALAAAANLLNPGAIVAGGIPADVQDPFLRAAREAFAEHALTSDAKRLRIRTPRLGTWVFAAGAAFAASSIDEASTFPVP